MSNTTAKLEKLTKYLNKARNEAETILNMKQDAFDQASSINRKLKEQAEEMKLLQDILREVEDRHADTVLALRKQVAELKGEPLDSFLPAGSLPPRRLDAGSVSEPASKRQKKTTGQSESRRGAAEAGPGPVAAAVAAAAAADKLPFTVSKGARTVTQAYVLPHNSVVCAVAFSPSGEQLATGSSRLTTVFDVATGQKLHEFHLPTSTTTTASAATTNTNAASNDSPSNDNNTKADGASNNNNTVYVRSLAFSPPTVTTGKFLASGSEDGQIRVWDLESGALHCQFFARANDCYSLSWSTDGHLLASATSDKTVRLWQWPDQKLVRELGNATDDGDAPALVCTGIVFSPDGSMLAAASLDQHLRLWDVSTGRLLCKVLAHEQPIYSVNFSADGSKLYSGARHIKCWSTANRTLTPIAELQGHADLALSIAAGPPGSHIMVSGSKDHSVIVWDTNHHPHTYQAIQAHTNSVLCVAVSPDRKTFASGGGDKRTIIWGF